MAWILCKKCRVLQAIYRRLIYLLWYICYICQICIEYLFIPTLLALHSLCNALWIYAAKFGITFFLIFIGKCRNNFASWSSRIILNSLSNLIGYGMINSFMQKRLNNVMQLVNFNGNCLIFVLNSKRFEMFLGYLEISLCRYCHLHPLLSWICYRA